MEKFLIKIGCLAAFLLLSNVVHAEYDTAIFAGGCFWCMQPPFEKLDGVKEVINDNYVILDILNCYGCEPSSAGNIIINIESGDDKYVKGASIMRANLANNTFSYQNLEIVKEPCQDGDLINCDRNNMMDVRKPSGEIFSEKLP